jgi:hypothetical protein
MKQLEIMVLKNAKPRKYLTSVKHQQVKQNQRWVLLRELQVIKYEQETLELLWQNQRKKVLKV